MKREGRNMEFKIGQECSRKKSSVVWKIVEVGEKEIKLERSLPKDKTSKRTVSLKLFTNRWIVNTK